MADAYDPEDEIVEIVDLTMDEDEVEGLRAPSPPPLVDLTADEDLPQVHLSPPGPRPEVGREQRAAYGAVPLPSPQEIQPRFEAKTDDSDQETPQEEEAEPLARLLHRSRQLSRGREITLRGILEGRQRVQVQGSGVAALEVALGVFDSSSEDEDEENDEVLWSEGSDDDEAPEDGDGDDEEQEEDSDSNSNSSLSTNGNENEPEIEQEEQQGGDQDQNNADNNNDDDVEDIADDDEIVDALGRASHSQLSEIKGMFRVLEAGQGLITLPGVERIFATLRLPISRNAIANLANKNFPNGDLGLDLPQVLGAVVVRLARRHRLHDDSWIFLGQAGPTQWPHQAVGSQPDQEQQQQPQAGPSGVSPPPPPSDHDTSMNYSNQNLNETTENADESVYSEQGNQPADTVDAALRRALARPREPHRRFQPYEVPDFMRALELQGDEDLLVARLRSDHTARARLARLHDKANQL